MDKVTIIPVGTLWVSETRVVFPGQTAAFDCKYEDFTYDRTFRWGWRVMRGPQDLGLITFRAIACSGDPSSCHNIAFAVTARDVLGGEDSLVIVGPGLSSLSPGTFKAMSSLGTVLLAQRGAENHAATEHLSALVQIVQSQYLGHYRTVFDRLGIKVTFAAR